MAQRLRAPVSRFKEDPLPNVPARDLEDKAASELEKLLTVAGSGGSLTVSALKEQHVDVAQNLRLSCYRKIGGLRLWLETLRPQLTAFVTLLRWNLWAYRS